MGDAVAQRARSAKAGAAAKIPARRFSPEGNARAHPDRPLSSSLASGGLLSTGHGTGRGCPGEAAPSDKVTRNLLFHEVGTPLDVAFAIGDQQVVAAGGQPCHG